MIQLKYLDTLDGLRFDYDSIFSRIAYPTKEETDSSYEITIPLPGFAKNEVELFTDGGYLHLKASRDKRKVDRLIDLPEGIDLESTTAELKYGELKISVPKTKGKPIKIK